MLPSPLGRSSSCGEAKAEALKQFRPRQSRLLAFLPRHGNSTDVCKALSQTTCATWPSPVTARLPTSSEGGLDHATSTRTPTLSASSTCPRFSARSW